MAKMTSGAEPDGRVFHTLDALRGIAAIGVVTFHMKEAFAPLAASGGYLAVDLFFMMSGVVLSHAYEDRFRNGMGTFDFMRARLIRLYPLYFLGIMFGIAVTLASMHGRNIQHWEASTLIQAALLALLFLPNFSGSPSDQMFPLNIPCWSLFFEVLVNLLFVVSWPLLTSRRLVIVCLLTGVGVVLTVVHGGDLDQGSATSDFVIGLGRTVFGFSMGILIARRVRSAYRGQNNFKVLALVAVVGIAIAGTPQGVWRVIWDSACVLVIFPLVVYWATLFDPGPRLREVATFLGVTSYAVYVLHSPLSSIVNSAARSVSGGAGVSAAAPYVGIGVLVVLLAGCWLVDRYFDMPIRRQLSRIVPKMQSLRSGT